MYCAHRSSRRFSRYLNALLACTLVAATVTPPAFAKSLALQVAATTDSKAWQTVKAWLESKDRSQDPLSRGVKPLPSESKAAKQGRVSRLEVNPQGPIRVQSRQPLVFTAVPRDSSGDAIHGLFAEWESSDKQIVFVKKNGQGVAGKPGTAVVTAKSGSLTASVRVTVNNAANAERFGGKKKQNTLRSNRRRAADQQKSNRENVAAQASRRHHAPDVTTAISPVPMRDPNDDPLPDDETTSLYQPANAIGSPPGRQRAGATTPGSTLDSVESGNKNFSFGLPVVGLPGRGLDVSLSLVYNSNVWNKSTDGFGTWMTYDVDSSWPATGWRMTLGQIEDQGSYGFTLTDMDGTRRALVYTSAYNYHTTDGSFIRYYGAGSWGVLYYPNGTIAYYGAGGGGYRLYPTQIVDRNGNYILISYVNSVGPKISTITDTVGRYINFYYASNGDLVTITRPGLGTSDLQTIRFYYTDVTLGSGLFDSNINVSSPSSVHTLEYIYLPTSSEANGAHTGYKFEYSPYGMVRRLTEYRGMTASTTSTTTAGTVSLSGAVISAQTTYNYPDSAQALTEVPTYSRRTDDWAGRTTSMNGGAPYYDFSVNESTGISSVTAPAGTIYETHSIVNAGQWNDGLVSDTYVKNGSTTYAQTHWDWELDSNNRNPRVYQIRSTDTPAGLTKATVLTYTSYNNVSVVSERDITTDGSVSSTELRRTEATFVTSSSYINRHLLHLPSIVKVFPGGSSTPSSRVDYTYDNYGTSHANMTSRDDIIMHDPAYDPFQETQESCDWVCREWDHWWVNCIDWQWECTYYNPYDANTDYRGNVTTVTGYADAANASGAINHSTTYDIAGNVTTADVDCCQTKSISYTDNPNTYTYAFPTSITNGNPSGVHTTMSATYSLNTGLRATTTDENNQTTTNYYHSDSLRLEHVSFTDGSGTYLTYSDALSADGAGRYLSYVEAATKLDNNGSGGATRYVTGRQYFDGRGAAARNMNNQTSADGWSVQDIEYDTSGRAYRASSPYYASSYSSTPLSSSNMFWTTTVFDHLGRVTQVTMPRGDNDNSLLTSVTFSFDGVYTTVTDPAGKVRRQKGDALGRVIRLDEPTTSGLGSTSSPNQATNYYYDALDNLVRINQDSQDRYFKYDSLSRLIRERQVEQTVNSNYNLSDSLTGNSSWTRKIEYNSSGLITNAYDARGVQTSFTYDALNRVTEISYSDSTPTAHYYYDSQTLPSGAPSTSSPDNYSRGYSTGRLVAMTYGSGATGTYFGYDTRGRVVQQFQLTGSTPTKYKLAYSYNYAGMLTGETYPSGRNLSYSHDEGGRLASVGDGTNTFTQSLQYAAHGGLRSETWGNTAVHTRDYNRRLQPSQVKLSLGSSVQQQYDYGYGEFNTSSGAVDTSKNNGQIGKIVATIGSTTQWSQGFGYDELGRIANVREYQSGSMSSQTYSHSYTYDRYGNRAQSANSTLGLSAVSLSDYSTSTNRFVSNVSYDNAGNVTQDNKFRGLSYTYDANGRMTVADSVNNDGYQTSIYDCAGKRVQTTSNAGTRTMVYDFFGQTVAEYSGTSGSTLERENIYRGGQLLAVYETAASCYMSISDFVDAFYQGTLGRAYNASTDPDWKNTLKQAQAQGLSQLIIAAQNLGASLFTSTEYLNRNRTNSQFVTDLYAGYLQRAPDQGGYDFWLNGLNNSTRDQVRLGFAYSTEFQNNVSRLCPSTSSSSATIKYVMTDVQGTTRAVMNNNGSSSSVISRHDFLPFGEEVWAGIGLRSTSQSYAATTAIRQKYGLTQRDEATGLDHTSWRKYESLSGRWTSPDPLSRSMVISNPQSFNRYTYTQNDPVNFIDPTGLRWIELCSWWAWFDVTDADNPIQVSDPFLRCSLYWVNDNPWGGNPGGGGPGGGSPGGQERRPPTLKPDPKREKECEQHRKNLLDNPTNKAALDAAWKNSHYGTATAHETGGLLGTSTLIHSDNRSVAELYEPPKGSPRASLTGHTGWVKQQVANSAGNIHYDYSFHTHPFDEGDPNPDGPGTIGSRKGISAGDEGAIRQQAIAQPGLHGVAISSTSIIVYDSNGTILCTFDR